MKWLDNRRIAAKVFLLPLIPVLCLVGLSFYAHQALLTQQAALTDVSEEYFGKVVLVSQLQKHAKSAQADLYRLTTWKAAGVDQKKLEKVKGEFKESISAIKEVEKKILKEKNSMSGRQNC